ncbi:hypothetical protein AAFF_G00438940 [Aldrovandia affinis]|uniref:NTR domain-containing protein n=1 Tax=Aldrovandia affinis TaxID=143900 RepID=A0AAD7S7D8_9TELE|nr:hypothetical protein AAFF_G00438940 [Aldrovandia affinis]
MQRRQGCKFTLRVIIAMKKITRSLLYLNKHHLRELSPRNKHCFPKLSWHKKPSPLKSNTHIRDVISGNEDQPFAQKSALGWSIVGYNSAAIDYEDELESCPSLKDKTEDLRFDKACSSTNYVYTMTVSEVRNSATVDRYKMEIKEVVKEGQDVVLAGQKREFVSHISCRGVLGLQQGQVLLIIGQTSDLMQKADGGYDYLLSAGTWLERIPSTAEQQGDKREISIAINDFVFELKMYGCPN